MMKKQFIFLKSSHLKLNLPNYIKFELGESNINPSENCRNLGVMFDSEMNFHCQIQSICKSVNFHLRNVGAVRHILPDSAAEQLVHALITSVLVLGMNPLKSSQGYQKEGVNVLYIIGKPKVSTIRKWMIAICK